MKQIFLLLLLAVTFTVTAQKTYSIEKPLQLNTVKAGAKSDSVLVRGVDNIVKFIPRSEFTAITDLSYTASPTDGTVLSNSGTAATLPLATIVNAGLLSPAEKVSLGLKANIASPAFTGIPSAPTAISNTNNTQIATTAFVTYAVSSANSQNVNTYAPQIITGAKTFTEKVVISGNNKYLEFSSGGFALGDYPFPSIGAYGGYFSIAGSGGLSAPIRIKTPNNTTVSNLYAFPDASGNIAITLDASAALDFPDTNPGSTSDLTITVSGAALGDVVSLGVPSTSVQSNAQYTAFVNAVNSVTVRFSNLQSSASQNPASGIFKVKVFK